MKTDSQPESQLPWTGERYVPEITGEIQLEHVHRYLLALEYAKDKDVLDIACGEGFGSEILSRAARSVIGVDIAEEAVRHASTRYQLDNVEFRQGSCAKIPLDNDSIDLVVSFETIEHHDEHQAMMIEIKRVLRPQGVLIISSPNKEVYSVLPNYHNPFHIRELTRKEFEDLVREYFQNLSLIYQRIVYGSGIIPENGAFRFIDYDIKDTNQPSLGLAGPRYLIAIASDEPLPALSGGLLEQAVEESEILKGLVAENENRTAINRQLEDHISQLEVQSAEHIHQSAEYIRQLELQSAEQIRQLEERSAEKARQLEEQLWTQSCQFSNKVRQLEEQVGQLNLSLHETRRLYQSMSSSLSWRLTWPLRYADAAIRSKVKRRYTSLPKGYPESSPTALQSGPSAVSAGPDPITSQLVTLIRRSSLFDPAAYDAAVEADAQGLDPALHYLLMGEKQGLRPGSDFDPVYYRDRYPDVAAWDGSALVHYIKWGQQEGRQALPIADALSFPLAKIKEDRPTVLLLVHEASRTGAPILGWNIARGLCERVNVVIVLMRAGRLSDAFDEVASAVVGPLASEIFDPLELSGLARRLAKIYRPSYAIANSVATGSLVPVIADEGIPVVALVHEFSSRVAPGSLRLLFDRAAEIVFSAEIVRRAAELDYPFLKLRNTHLLPQGPSKVPPSGAPAESRMIETELAIRRKLRPKGAEGNLLVVGMGFIEWRKGVDLFIAAATSILARDPAAPVRFVWVGEGFRSPIAAEVSSYLSEQMMRSGLGGHFDLMDAVDDIESIYREVDVLFLSSRLDPLPNVAIDATLRGIPVVCFADASGIAEILTSNDETRELVVPHLDVGAAAQLIATLAADRNKLRHFGDAVRDLGRARFNLDAYVTALDELGRQAKSSAEQEELDATLILTTGAFDLPLYIGDRGQSVELTAAVQEYSAISRKYNYARAPVVHQACTRRPLAGFHPITYALQNPDYGTQTNNDPLAHYLRSGRPVGPWVHSVLRLEAPRDTVRPLPKAEPPPLRVILHGHFHYTDHFSDFLRALAGNVQRCELILTTDSTEKAAELATGLGESRIKADIRVLPNRGRDIAPFLTVLEETMGRCDLLGHLHGKRSPHVDKSVGDSWRTFLWQHLIGGELPMVDVIKQAFLDDARLGLVFPEDPYLVGWDQNFGMARELAARMGLRTPLPASFECPVGTMFWTRPEALAPLLRLGLTRDEYPREPVPIDGTILHALERLLAIVAEDAGYHFVTTYLPRFVR